MKTGPGAVRVRFAPSPTGHLHVGGARTAIFNWLFARHWQGAFVLRIEDTDQERSTRESEQMVLEDLRWLGLDWDEGPDVGGSCGPYRQSERREFYAKAALELLDRGHAYRCFCSEEELDVRRKQAESEGRAPHYDLKCFRLNPAEVKSRIVENQTFAVRFHVPKEEAASFDADVEIHDAIRGSVSWKKETLGDFILVRSDGMPTYNFSVVVDDHAMVISHVIRAEEHLTNTHRQVLIYRALGWEQPQFAHVSLILAPDRTKLSKRHGATSVAAYRERGFLPEATVNYLTLLGWSSTEEREFFTRDYSVEHFSLERVNASPAVFDETKFTWLNGQHIHHMLSAELYDRLHDRLEAEGWLSEEVSPATRAWFEEAIEAVKKKVQRLDEFVDALRFLFSFEPETALRPHREILSAPESKGLITAVVLELRQGGAPLDAEAYATFAGKLKASTGLKTKQLYMPMRLALTGMDQGPDLQRIFSLLEKGSTTAGLPPVESPLQRIERVLEILNR